MSRTIVEFEYNFYKMIENSYFISKKKDFLFEVSRYFNVEPPMKRN